MRELRRLRRLLRLRSLGDCAIRWRARRSRAAERPQARGVCLRRSASIVSSHLGEGDAVEIFRGFDHRHFMADAEFRDVVGVRQNGAVRRHLPVALLAKTFLLQPACEADRGHASEHRRDFIVMPGLVGLARFRGQIFYRVPIGAQAFDRDVGKNLFELEFLVFVGVGRSVETNPESKSSRPPSRACPASRA